MIRYTAPWKKIIYLSLGSCSLVPMALASYLPVSILLFFGKVIERVLADQLEQFLVDTSLLDPAQSGFWPGYNIEMVLVALINDLQRHLDKGGLVLLVLLDLSA